MHHGMHANHLKSLGVEDMELVVLVTALPWLAKRAVLLGACATVQSGVPDCVVYARL